MADVTGNPPVPANIETGQESCPEAGTAAGEVVGGSCGGGAGGVASSATHTQREERNKLIRERQNEERQRKLEELKQQAVATQKFREQQEEERRRRIEEQRLRDSERRTQVEERKKALLEAEKERREAMLRRTEDRGNRMEMKRRNERGSMAFAFGSSTPRMLEPAESLTSYWGPRRATSTTNVMSSSVHGRTTVTDNGAATSVSSKRASSVFGLDLNQGRFDTPMVQIFDWDSSRDYSRAEKTPEASRWTSYRSSLYGGGCVFQGDDLMTQSTSAVLCGPSGGGRRRRTDLMPTIPIHRDLKSSTPGASPSSFRSSSSASSVHRGSAMSRSTGMSVSLSRLDQLSLPRTRRTSGTSGGTSSHPLKPLHENPSSGGNPFPASGASGASGASAPRCNINNNNNNNDNNKSAPVNCGRPARPKDLAISHSMSQPPPEASTTPGTAPATPATPSTPSDFLAPRSTRAQRLRQKAQQRQTMSSSVGPDGG